MFCIRGFIVSFWILSLETRLNFFGFYRLEMDIEMEKLCISFARLTTKSEVELLCDKLQKLTVRKGEKRRRNQGDGDDDAPDAPPLKIQRRIPVARKILVQGKLFYCLWRKPKLIYHEKWRLRCFYIPRHVVRDRNM